MRQPVYLVRHGQSSWNVRRLTQGQIAHPPLTSLGRTQARGAAQAIAADLRLLGLTSRRLVTSDLARARQSAAIIGTILELTAVTDERLREQHLGWLQGRGYDQTWAASEEHDWSDPALPRAGGESLAQVRMRMAAVLAEVDPTVVTVLVSHGDAIRAAVAHWSGHPPTEAPWVEVPNGAVARLDEAVTWLT